MNAATDTLTDDAITMTAMTNAEMTIAGTGMSETTPRTMTDAETIDARGTETSEGTKSEDFSEEKNAGKQQGIPTRHWHRTTGKTKTTAGLYPPPKLETEQNQVTITKCIVTTAGKRGITAINAQARQMKNSQQLIWLLPK